MLKQKQAVVFLAVTGPLLLVSLVPARTPVNPPIDPANTFETALNPPRDIRGMLRRACYDCHSNETRWPWYSRTAPGSWIVGRDVEHARHAFNFSDWSGGVAKRQVSGGGILLAACAAVENGYMPPSQYRMLHRDAALSPAEMQRFCQWTSSAARQLLAARARRP